MKENVREDRTQDTNKHNRNSMVHEERSVQRQLKINTIKSQLMKRTMKTMEDYKN